MRIELMVDPKTGQCGMGVAPTSDEEAVGFAPEPTQLASILCQMAAQVLNQPKPEPRRIIPATFQPKFVEKKD